MSHEPRAFRQWRGTQPERERGVGRPNMFLGSAHRVLLRLSIAACSYIWSLTIAIVTILYHCTGLGRVISCTGLHMVSVAPASSRVQ